MKPDHEKKLKLYRPDGTSIELSEDEVMERLAAAFSRRVDVQPQVVLSPEKEP